MRTRSTSSTMVVAALAAVLTMGLAGCSAGQTAGGTTADGRLILEVGPLDTSSSWTLEPDEVSQKIADGRADGTISEDSASFAVRLGDEIVVGLYGSSTCVPVLESATLGSGQNPDLIAVQTAPDTDAVCTFDFVGPFGFRIGGADLAGVDEVTVETSAGPFVLPVHELD